ncbi:MAG: threonine--tRNA ligase [Candidatus Yanofskybacteria bacterium]|nr:threonine--tRNA ligase [Candidatus Yanofskybacteria bacterium]
MMDDKINKIRHSLAHVMAAAVQEIYPDVKFGIGPVIENGFFYDFDFPSQEGNKTQLAADILPEAEKRMRSIIKNNLPIEQVFLDIDKAEKDAKIQGQIYKAELLEEIRKGERPSAESDTEKTKDGKISFYKIGNFIDLCKGPHVKNTKDLPADGFKLTRLAGAYWKGDSSKPQMQRIYGVAFSSKKELESYLELQKEVEKRDHRKLGAELDLFVFSDLVGSGLPLWTPKGTLLRDALDNFVWELRKKHGYERVDIPHITKKDLYEKSGHWEKFKDELFKITTREGHLFTMKPMNCPHHAQIYARKTFSYRELPQRYASTTKVYRDEQTGELAGLSRVRAITQDDAHVFCRYPQVKEEILKIWEIVKEFYEAASFKLEIRLSLHDPKHMEKYLGNEQTWEKAENQLREITKEKKAKAVESVGEAAFYGPKIDFMAKDSIGREWQVATIQLDMNLPERFDLTCVNEKGEKERIVMIHAAIMGSIERYLSILIEHYAGAFPVWLAPVQAIVVPISDKSTSYGQSVYERLVKENLRVEIDSRSESVGKKIREAEMQKIPYILIVGEKEQKAKSVAVRQRGKGDTGLVKIEKFVEKIAKEIKEKKSS